MREGFLSVDARGARLYWRETGAGAPLLVLHGGPDFNHRYLLPELDALGSALRLICYDQRGRGKSSSGVDPQDVSIESEVQDLDDLRRALGLQRFALLGHSFGALLALEYAARWPERVSRLVLANAAPGAHADWLALHRQRREREAAPLALMQRIAGEPGYARGDIAVEADYYRVHFGSALCDHTLVDEVVRRLRLDFEPADIVKARAIEERLYQQTWRQPGYDVVARVALRPPPTLVIHGDHDFIPVSAARRIAERLAGARLEVIGDCGHFAYLEKPQEFHRLVTGFVAQA